MLIIDDDLGILNIYARMLRGAGFTVLTANDAESGLEWASYTRPAAILLDLRMPRVDGLEFLRRLRSCADLARTPVGILTGDCRLDDVMATQLKALRIEELRLKPLPLEDVVGLVQQLMGETEHQPR